MNNPFLNRNANPGRLSERRQAKALKGRLQPASGALVGRKGDFVVKGKHKFLLEAKATTQASLSLKSAWLDKIREEALAQGCLPALILAFVTANGQAHTDEWVAVPRSIFEELIG